MLREMLAGSLLVTASLLLVPRPAAARVDRPLEPLVVWRAIVEIEWQAGERRGRPVLRGYLINRSPYPLIRIQLLVDALDESGSVLAQRVVWVGDDLPASGRVYFEVEAPRSATRYRVRPFAFDRRRH